MKTVIFVPAYEAEKTLQDIIMRIPQEVYEDIGEILIQDDASHDNTYKVARRLAEEFGKITVVRNKHNLGYGGTKKKAYKYCINKGCEVVVMLHGDGQLAPESLPDMLAPLLSSNTDIVLGSRMIGDSLGGGMPLYKWIGNRFLTMIANRSLKLRLTDYHTGYRAYRCAALAQLDFETCSNGHEISMELLIRAAKKELKITEVPVSTYYGPDSRSCSLKTSILYGLNVIKMLML